MELNLALLLVEPAAFVAGLGILRLPADALRARRRPVLAALAVLSAAAAAASGGSPTGWPALDILLLAGLGAAVVLAGARAPSVVILVGGLACAAAGLGSMALPLALAAAGLAMSGVVDEAEPLLDAAAAGLLVQAALRLEAPGGRGQSAAVAAVVLVPLLFAAVRTLEPPARRMLTRAALAAGGFAIVGAIAGGVAAASAVGPLRRGLSTASATIDATSAAELETTATGLAEAGRDFGEARRSLEAWWALPARAVPVVGQHWRVLRAAAVTGDELAGAGRRALEAPALGDVRVSDGRVPIEQLAAIEAPVADVAARATAARRRLDGARSAWLVPPLADKLDAQRVRLHDIERSAQLANRVLPTLPRLFGKDGPRRYFLAIQTPVEARAGGGFIGNYGEVTAEDGRLSLTRIGRQVELTNTGLVDRKLEAPDEFLARYARFRPEHTWANVNLSPDFPTDAAVIANLYPQSGGAPIDGVIAVDPAGLAALLAVVGSVEVPSWPTPITAANALQILQYDQYQRFGGAREDQRVDFLGEVAQLAWARLTSGALPPVPQVIAALGPAVGAKHLMFWSARPEEERLFEQMGGSGRIPPVTGDFVGLVTQNAGGNKIDYFLRRQMDYRVRLNPSTGRLAATATITLHNDAPADGLSFSLIGNEVSPPLPNGTNRLYLSFYTPWELAGARLDGAPIELEQATELGRRVYSTGIVIPPKSTATLEVTLSGRLEPDDDYRLDVYRQPVVAPDDVTTTLELVGGWEADGGGAGPTRTLRLEADAVVEVPLRRR